MYWRTTWRESAEDWRLASGRIKMQDFNSPASVIWVLWPGGGLGLCIFLIGICGGTKINEDLRLTNQLGRAVERNSSWSSSFWCVCVCISSSQSITVEQPLTNKAWLAVSTLTNHSQGIGMKLQHGCLPPQKQTINYECLVITSGKNKMIINNLISTQEWTNYFHFMTKYLFKCSTGPSNCLLLWICLHIDLCGQTDDLLT